MFMLQHITINNKIEIYLQTAGYNVTKLGSNKILLREADW